MCVARVASIWETYGGISDKVIGSEQATEGSECHVKELFLLFCSKSHRRFGGSEFIGSDLCLGR